MKQVPEFQVIFMSALEKLHPGTLDVIEKLANVIPWGQVLTTLLQALTNYAPSFGTFATYLQQIINDLFPSPTPSPTPSPAPTPPVPAA
jgi:hypothetical protein